MSPSLSVAICTHNGARYLERVLGALESQTCDRAALEIVVVDNASQDATAAICAVASAEGRIDTLVNEAVLGLSHARNTAVHHAKGQVLAFLDDDAIPDSHWAEHLLAAFDDETVGVAGGEVALVYDEGRPEWMTDALELYLSRVNLGDTARDVNLPAEWIAGANIAFRRSLLDENVFASALGRRGRSLLSGEETEICLRLRDLGWRVVWVPNAVVAHQVPPWRATARYLRRRAFAGGYSAELVHARTQPDWSRSAALGRSLRTLMAGGVRTIRWIRRPSSATEATVVACSGAGSLRFALTGDAGSDGSSR